MINVNEIERKAYCNKYDSDDALKGKDVINMIREIKRLQEENKELRTEMVTEKPEESIPEYKEEITSVEKKDLIEAMAIAIDQDSLKPIQYVLNKTQEGVIAIYG